MTLLTTMMNIGKEMASKLKSVEIDCAEKLIEVGAARRKIIRRADLPTPIIH